jgi:hypothetical protein
MKLTVCLHTASRLRMCGAVPLLPLCAFMAWTRKTLNFFTFTQISCSVARIICGSSVWNLLHVTLLAPRNLRWFLNFWRIYASSCRVLDSECWKWKNVTTVKLRGNPSQSFNLVRCVKRNDNPVLCGPIRAVL